jgi:hypothetical protein
MEGSSIDDRSTTQLRHPSSAPQDCESASSSMLSPPRTAESAALHESKCPKMYLLIENKSKSNNLGTELRCAAAFGVEAVVIVGFGRFADYGSHGASKHVPAISFPTVDKAIAFISDECGCESIIGTIGCVPGGYSRTGYPVVESSNVGQVEVRGPFSGSSDTKSIDKEKIVGRSYPISSVQFQMRNTCVVICKQVHGLPIDLARHCGVFTHVPHVPVHIPNGFVSVEGLPDPFLLNQPSFLSIILCRFTELLGFAEHSYLGHKYEVSQLRTHRDDEHAENQRHRRSEERLEQEKAANALVDESVMVSLFSIAGDDGEV